MYESHHMFVTQNLNTVALLLSSRNLQNNMSYIEKPMYMFLKTTTNAYMSF